MPLIGIVDPSHAGRAEEVEGTYPNWIPLDQVLERAYDPSEGPNWSPWPYELLKTALDQHEERDYISVTALTGSCGRGLVISRREDYIQGVDEMYRSMRGTLLHKALEDSARDNSIAEVRFYTTLTLANGESVQLSCAPDLITQDTLWDYKMTENPPQFNYPWKSHGLQVQFNRYVVNHAEAWDYNGEVPNLPFNPREWKPDHLALVYLGPYGPKVLETTKSIQVPKKSGDGTKAKRVSDVWSDDQVLEELVPRLNAVALALDAYPDWPKGLETYPGFDGPAGWRCPGRPICYFDTCLAKRWPHGLVWS